MFILCMRSILITYTLIWKVLESRSEKSIFSIINKILYNYRIVFCLLNFIFKKF